jgi:four helix bundle protein
MSGVRRFEDLIAWQRARQLAGQVYEATSRGAISDAFALKDQMRRAAISVVSNIAEGYERHGRRDFARCVGIAKGSAGELRAQIHLATDLRLLEPVIARELLESCEEVSRILAGLRRALEAPRKQQPR